MKYGGGGAAAAAMWLVNGSVAIMAARSSGIVSA